MVNPTALVALFFVGTGPAFSETSKELFTELHGAGGVHPLAQLVCYPAAGQGQDTTFVLVAFSKDIASTLRAKGKPVPKESLDAEKAPEGERFLLQWAFRNGVQLNNDPEVSDAVAGSKGAMWLSGELQENGHKFAARMVFSLSGRYSRDVLVDGRVTKSVHGRCEPVP